MITTQRAQKEACDEELATISFYTEDDVAVEQSLATAIKHSNPTTQLLLASNLLTHTPDSGLNPLVDAAAYLFSIMGKLKCLKSYRNLKKLHDELVYEIEIFRENAKAHYQNNEHIAEYIPITCFALCATLDDIILSTPWGNQGQWEPYRLLETFYKDAISSEGFFIILERLIRDPNVYIDIMEFLYLCLSLGFKGQYKFSAFDYEQLEHITNALYKRVRVYRGDFNKTLSPFFIKPKVTASVRSVTKSMPDWLVILLFGGCIVMLFLGARYLLDFSF